MAEAFAVVGLAASIVTFVDVSAKVLKRLREFYSTAEDMPGVFQDIMTQLPLIVDTMTWIEEGYEGGSLTGDTQQKLLHVVKGCLRQITMLDGLIEKILRNPTDSRLRQARKAIASIFKEKDVAVIQRTLETYKSTLTLYFSQGPRASIAIATRENTYYEIPSLRASQFVERVELLEEIEAGLLNTTAHAPDVKIAVLLGMGGQGKTQLALEYCRVSRMSGRYQGIFWIDASSPNTVSCGFETIAAKISRIGCVFVDVESKIAFVKETLGGWKIPWLIVFDNYDQPGEFRNIAEYFPHGSGAILVTSRHSDSERLGATIRFTRMTEDEGLELLLRQTKLEKNDDNIIEGKKIIQKLSYLPLAIDQAAAYINTRKLPLPLFAKHYDERKELVLKHTPPLWEYRKRLGKDKDETLLSVFTTWELSFQQIGKNKNERMMVSHFLTLSAFFDATNINEDLFRSHLAANIKPLPWIEHFIPRDIRDRYKSPWWMKHFVSGGIWDQYKYQDTIMELLSLSLLQGVNIGSVESCFSLHPLVTDWLKLRIDRKDRQKYVIEATTVLKSYIDMQDKEKLSLQTKLDALSHVDMCLRNGREYLQELDRSKISSLRDSAFTFASLYQSHCRYQDAEVMYQQALTGYEKVLGPEHTSTLATVHNLGRLYRDQGKLAEAEAMYQRALAGEEKALGPEHTSTLDTVNNLGSLYRD